MSLVHSLPFLLCISTACGVYVFACGLADCYCGLQVCRRRLVGLPKRAATECVHRENINPTTVSRFAPRGGGLSGLGPRFTDNIIIYNRVPCEVIKNVTRDDDGAGRERERELLLLVTCVRCDARRRVCWVSVEKIV